MKNQARQKKEDHGLTNGVHRFTYTPKVDIWETEDGYKLEVEMPGVDRDRVDVKLEDSVLYIIGRVQAEKFDGYGKAWTEYEVGNYERRFRVPDGIDQSKIQASISNGILNLQLPKREAAKPKRIDVMAA